MSTCWPPTADSDSVWSWSARWLTADPARACAGCCTPPTRGGSMQSSGSARDPRRTRWWNDPRLRAGRLLSSLLRPVGPQDPSPFPPRTASYEADPASVRRVLLLYSGGLDTSVMLKWIQDSYGAEVVCLTVNLGQPGEDYEVIKGKAVQLGAT